MKLRIQMAMLRCQQLQGSFCSYIPKSKLNRTWARDESQCFVLVGECNVPFLDQGDSHCHYMLVINDHLSEVEWEILHIDWNRIVSQVPVVKIYVNWECSNLLDAMWVHFVIEVEVFTAINEYIFLDKFRKALSKSDFQTWFVRWEAAKDFLIFPWSFCGVLIKLWDELLRVSGIDLTEHADGDCERH